MSKKRGHRIKPRRYRRKAPGGVSFEGSYLSLMNKRQRYRFRKKHGYSKRPLKRVQNLMNDRAREFMVGSIMRTKKRSRRSAEYNLPIPYYKLADIRRLDFDFDWKNGASEVNRIAKTSWRWAKGKPVYFGFDIEIKDKTTQKPFTHTPFTRAQVFKKFKEYRFAMLDMMTQKLDKWVEAYNFTVLYTSTHAPWEGFQEREIPVTTRFSVYIQKL